MTLSGTTVKRVMLAGGILLVLIQFIPYGRDHNNPAVVREPAWDSPATRELAKRACFNCHSHETVWPSYSRMAPVSWLIYHDVREARSKVNFSDWQKEPRPGETASNFRQEIREGGMPPLPYRMMHPEARLTDQEKQKLVEGLAATVHAPR